MIAVRPARAEDLPAVAAIYNQGIDDRRATFETRRRDPEELRSWLDGPPFLVAERQGRVIGFARVSPTSERRVYAGVGEYTVYVERGLRGEGVGHRLLAALLAEAERRGYYKLISRIFATNAPSLALARAAGFREVGVQQRHGRLDGEWKDCVLVEILLGEAAADAGAAPAERPLRAARG
jgi:phosphinothricin acetyltransferase